MAAVTTKRALAPYQQALMERIAAALEAEPRIEAAWLAGSLGKGEGDDFSDVDVLALATAGNFAAASAALAEKLSTIATPVLVNNLFGGRVLNVVTAEWHRFDISFIEGEEIGRYDAEALTPLFHRGTRQPPSRPPVAYRTPPGELLKLVQEFLRVLGLSIVAIGRREYVLGLSGIELLRRMTTDLMLEENGVSPAARGGALHRNPMLSDDQREALEAVPPLSATRESVIEGSRYLASAFLPRAKRLAGEIGMEWPVAFEDATRKSLRERLGMEI